MANTVTTVTTSRRQQPKGARAGQNKNKEKAVKGQKKSMSKRDKRQAKLARLRSDAGVRAERFYLSACSRDYLKALCDPFNLEGGHACIPDLIDMPSAKFCFKSRGTGFIGTAGIGFIAVAPLAIANDTNAVAVSAALYANQTFSTSGAANVNSSTPVTPYQTAAIASLYHRTVGCAIRIRYTGTELNKAGQFVGIRVASGGSLNGMDTDECLKNYAVTSIQVTRNWKQVYYVPSGNGDYSYSNLTPSSSVAGDLRLGFILSGTKGEPFEWEVLWHKEVTNLDQNSIGIMNLTASHSDVAGLSAIRTFFEGAISYVGGDQVYKQALTWISQFSPTDVSHVVAAGSLLYRQASAAYNAAPTLSW